MRGCRHAAFVLGALVLSTGPSPAQQTGTSAGISVRDRYSGPVAPSRDRPRPAAPLATALPSTPPIIHYQEMGLRPGLRVTGATRATANLAAALPLKERGGFLVYELRAGKLVTIINGDRKERRSGEFWIVGPSDDVTLETADDSVVLQTIQLPDK